MNFVGVDIGASSTRYVADNGKIGVLPNNMVILNENARVDLEAYSDNIESALEVIIEKESDSEHFPVRVLMGQMATRHSTTNLKPSVMSNKHKQRINFISIIAAAAVAKVNQGLSDDIYLYLALPPVETRVAKDAMKAALIGKYTVTFPKFKNTKVKFNVSDASCFEESFLALLSYFFEMNGSMREGIKYTTGNIMSLDIGASTSDLAIVTDMKYMEKSGQTYKTGGNVARDFLMDDIRAEYGYDVPHEIADAAMAEGRLQMGDGYEDIAHMVAAAKERFAAQVVEQIQGYFRKVNIPIQSIRAIIVSGGGSMRSEYLDGNNEVVVTTEPMSHYITKELNNVCSGVKVEHHGSNPRMANVMGLYIRAKIDMKRRETNHKRHLELVRQEEKQNVPPENNSVASEVRI